MDKSNNERGTKKMSMTSWYNVPAETKINAYTHIGENTGMAPYAVEKDWWVVQTLAIIFEMEIGAHLVFKGGTSLSKAWKLIDRFSEDIDLAVDRHFLGFRGDLPRTQVANLRKAANAYITDKFYPALIERFQKKGFTEVTFRIMEANTTDQDPRIIEVYYPNVIATPGYIQSRVQIEIGCRSLREPFSNKSCSSLIDEYYPEATFTQAPINIPAVNPERTLLEKVFLLHEEFQRPSEKIRVDRLSRHLYDIYQLSKTEFAEKAFESQMLYETIVNHRYKFTRVGGVDYNFHQPKHINPIPTDDLIEAWKKDYRTMQEQMIYGAPLI
jgi:hypothetical protein